MHLVEQGKQRFAHTPVSQFSNSQDVSVVKPSLRAKRSNPFFLCVARWIASLRSQRRCSTFTDDFAISRRGAPESCIYLSPKRGRGECRMPVAPAASCALCVW